MNEKDLDTAIEKCERIMEFDTRTLKNPESEDGWLFDKVYDLLKFLRQLQFATDTNVGGMDDTISRQAITDAVDGVTWYHQNKDGEMVHGANSDEHQAWYKADDIYKTIEALPSAQPVNIAKLQPNCNQVASDCISRQAAIDALMAWEEDSIWDEECLKHRGEPFWVAPSDVIEQLPSAQPEIIYCKDCIKHNKGHGFYYDGTVIGIKDCCPLVEIRGRAQGHEFDYQFCVYAERRQDG